MTTTTDIVAKLWNLCHVLRDDGITYHQYVTELTYLLFLKMAAETGAEDNLPPQYRWANLKAHSGVKQLTFYRELLIHLGTEAAPRVQAIYANAQTALTKPTNLSTLVASIDALDWYSAREEGLGDLYEGLLEKNANEKKSGAGQYFTPRPLIDCMVALIKPRAGEVVSDPAAGTLGFIIAADAYIKAQTDGLYTLKTAEQEFQKTKAYYAIELVADARRLALMNAMLHKIESDVLLGDTLSSLGTEVPRSDVILTNPPFGTKKGGGTPTRDDFTFATSNKQLAFLQHIYRNLKPGGRAAVVLPDNVLFEDNVGQKIRADLMDKCRLHTILRLPTGIFYAAGVKTNVLFFERGKGPKGDKAQTDAVWIYDARTNMPSFGVRTPFGIEHLQPFMDAYGADANGKSKRVDEGEEGRFRRFTREAIAARGDNLDITWLRDENVDRAEDLAEPDVIAAEILEYLRTATEEMQALMELLEPGEVGRERRGIAAEELGASAVAEIGARVEEPVRTCGQSSRMRNDGWPFRRSSVQSEHYVASGVRVIRTRQSSLGITSRPRTSFIATSSRWAGSIFAAWRPSGISRTVVPVVPDIGTAIVKADASTIDLMRLAAIRDRLRLMHASSRVLKNAPSVKAYLDEVNHGATRDGVNTEQLCEMPVLVPPINEQKRIVAKLDALQARSEAAKEALDAIPPLLEKFRQSVLASAFRGDLTRKWREQNPDVEPASELLARIRAERRRRWQEANPKKQYVEPEPVDATGLPELPERWCWAPLEDLVPAEGGCLRTNGQPGKTEVVGGVPFCSPSPHHGGGCGSTTPRPSRLAETISRDAWKISPSRLEAGDILFSSVGAIGKSARSAAICCAARIPDCIHPSG